MKSLLVFVVGALVFGAISLGIGYAIAEQDALIQGGVAFGLAFVPAVGTLAWVVFSYRSVPQMQLMASLGSSGVRMAIALGGAWYLTSTQPQTFDTALWAWLLWFYLVLLAFEITVLVWQQSKIRVESGQQSP
ncbi:MAG: hypothetical protein HY289_07870 [Planctomycetes bacterium]|nr:hypothetical protein [Planctomycetota bacterium]